MKSKTILSLLSLVSFSSLAIGQVGINTSTPQSSLDVVGNGASTSAKDGIIAPRVSKQQLASKVAGTYAAAQTGSAVYVNDITAPTGTTPSLAQVAQVSTIGYYYFDGTLWVAYGSTVPSVNIYNSNGSLTGNRIVTQAGNTLAFTSTATNGFSVDGSTFSVDAANDRVGIGVAAPTARMHIVSSTAGALRLVDGTESAGRLLTSDANGVGTWQAAPASVNIYNANGSLTGNRIVTQAGNTLAFTSTATNGFSVDGSTFSVDAANDRVGVGTAAPNSKLDLGASVGATITDVVGKKLAVYNNAAGTSFYGLGVSPARLQFHASSAAADTPGAVLTDTGNMGIGITDPLNRLHVVSSTAGAVRLVDGTQSAGRILTSDANGVGTWQAAPASVNIYNTNGSLTSNRTVTQAANTLAFTSTVTNGFSVDGSTFSVDAANDRIGMGTTAPNSRLDLGTTAGASITDVAGKKLAVYNNVGATSFYGLGVSSGRLQFHAASATTDTPGAVLTDTGNIGIGVTDPTNRLHVSGANPLRLQGLSAGTTTTDQLVVIDATGVVKAIGTLGALSIPNPAVFRLETAQNNFLNGQGAGGSQVVPMSVVKNTIPGMSYNAGTSIITFPAGTYQLTFVYEATHNITGCTISSYFVDFPLNATTSRIHSTASHVEGGLSNHGGAITYATTIPAGTTWQLRLGRGQSGNCGGTGMTLAANSTQVLVFRIGD
ncbi:hypothetical protein [Chryseobacterium sp. JUb7]|uniref:beta strand repeat-containing protein n=1 Tax=Chryseobacterium sp. JUb7 TaxID=2940599 RepID=UPI002168CB3A|nr:hypothetical protein [Chryseobacterium sp. JUb7]MCS3530522.1 hypothetical protein [Chryseobacterium sp. JUb7]